MVKTLPTVAFYLIKGDRLKPVILISGSFGTWGSKGLNPFILNGITYEDQLLKLGTIELSADIFEDGLADFSDLTFTLQNREEISDVLAPFNVENKDVIVYLALDVPNFSSGSLVTLYQGAVKDYKWDDESFNITLWGKAFDIYNTSLPKNKITVEDYPSADPGIIGQTLPIIYGDFYSNAALSLPYDPIIADGKTTPTVCVEKGKNDFRIAGHPIKNFVLSTLSANSYLSSIFQYESGNSQLVYIYDAGGSINLSNASFTLSDDVRGSLRFLPTIEGKENTAADVKNLMDGPDGVNPLFTYAHLSGSGQGCSVKWNPFSNIGDISYCLNVTKDGKWQVMFDGSTANCKLQYSSSSAGAVWKDGPTINTPAGGTDASITIPTEVSILKGKSTPMTLNELSQFSFRILQISAGTIVIRFMRLLLPQILLTQSFLYEPGKETYLWPLKPMRFPEDWGYGLY